MQGTETLPRIAVRSDKETGFTHGIKPKAAFGTGEVIDVGSECYLLAYSIQFEPIDAIKNAIVFLSFFFDLVSTRKAFSE